MSDNISNVARSALYFSAIVISLAGIKFSAPILVPFLLALFVAIICTPAINLLQSYKVPRSIGSLFIIIVMILMFIVFGGIIASSINDFRQALPSYEIQISQELEWITALLSKHNITFSTIDIQSYFNPAKIMNLVSTTLNGFSNILGNFFLLLLTVIFMLSEGEGFTNKIHVAFDNSANKERGIHEFIEAVNRYMAIKTMVSLATAFIIGFVLSLMNVDFFVLWALLAFLLNYIPNIGSIIAAIPAVILTFLQHGLGSASIVVCLFVTVNMVMGNIIEPKFMGRSLGLSTLVVFLSLIFWGWLLGMVGMLLSVPLTMIFKIALENTDARWFAVLLSSEQEINEQQRLLDKLKDNQGTEE